MSQLKCLLDTHVLISALLHPESVPGMAYFTATEQPYDGLVCAYSIDEMEEVFKRKFLKKIGCIDPFIRKMRMKVRIIPTPSSEEKAANEEMIRDPKDIPLYRAAALAGVDIIITGDKDFLESGITRPRIMTPAQFVAEARQ